MSHDPYWERPQFLEKLEELKSICKRVDDAAAAEFKKLQQHYQLVLWELFRDGDDEYHQIRNMSFKLHRMIAKTTLSIGNKPYDTQPDYEWQWVDYYRIARDLSEQVQEIVAVYESAFLPAIHNFYKTQSVESILNGKGASAGASQVSTESPDVYATLQPSRFWYTP